jgi:predicted metal-dependent hydrolase
MDYSSMMNKYTKWIDGKKSEIEKALKLSSKLILENRSVEDIKDLVHYMIEEYSKEYGLVVNRTIFRRLKSKWGSCSRQGNLTFNTTLTSLPDRYIKYIVFHELMHMIERKHSKKFWILIEERFPKYKNIERELFSYWFLIANKSDKLSKRIKLST